MSIINMEPGNHASAQMQCRGTGFPCKREQLASAIGQVLGRGTGFFAGSASIPSTGIILLGWDYSKLLLAWVGLGVV